MLLLSMIMKQFTPPPLVINEGFFVDLEYEDYIEMLSHLENWEFYCTYQLRPDALTGRHQILQLHSMQISYVQRPGGMMNSHVSAKDCLNFAVLEENADKACFDRMKPKAGDIVFFDDSRPLNFMTNDAFKLCTVMIPKNALGELLPMFSQALYHTIRDTNGIMAGTLHDIWKQFTDESVKNDTETFIDAEKKIKDLLMKLLSEQTPILPKLTKGEETVLKIRDELYHHMDWTISIEALCKLHKISEKSLINSFKSLFGFTPNLFIRLLKLNLVHNELKKSDYGEVSVSRIAQKWGFSHMGRFSQYYTELFGKNPSKTLTREYAKEIPIVDSCVQRQEEII